MTLDPIEPKPQLPPKKQKPPWSSPLDYLSDLKTKRGVLLTQLQNEILALKREQSISTEDLQAFKSELAVKFRQIEQFAECQEKVFSLTGYSSEAEVARNCFCVVAACEVVQSAYVETDAFLTRGQVQKGSRLLNYLQLVSNLKKAETTATPPKPSLSGLQIHSRESLEKLKGSRVDSDLISLIVDQAQNLKQAAP